MKKRYLFIVLIILSILSIFIGVTNISIKDILNFNIDKIVNYDGPNGFVNSITVTEE